MIPILIAWAVVFIGIPIAFIVGLRDPARPSGLLDRRLGRLYGRRSLDELTRSRP